MIPSSDHSQEATEAVPIFVVEDDPFLRELAELLLKSEEYTCRSFKIAEDALKAFQAAEPKPRLIISDYSLGLHAMDGVALLAECKRLCPAVKALLISGTVDDSIIPVNGNPVDRFLAKPYKTDDFLDTVKLLLK
jgi:DNA-binding NtrC family response regulator